MTTEVPSIASLVDRYISDSGKPLYRIAAESGFNAPNVLSMIRTGRTKLPLDKIPAFARSLGVEPEPLLIAALQAYKPQLWEVIDSVLLRNAGERHAATA